MFASAIDSIKGAFVTKPFVPNAYQANPSQIVNNLEEAFKAMFETAPDMSDLKTITPRQAYAGGENVFTYAAKRTQVHIGLAYDDLKQELMDAYGVGTLIILSLPVTASDEFSRIVMGFAVPLNYAYYTTKHVSFDAGKFAAGVAAQMHATKLAMKKHARRIGGEVKPVHTKQVVLSSGKVLTAQLTSDGTVTMFRSYGDADVAAVSWHESRFAVKVTKIVKNAKVLDFIKPYDWNEDEFNSVFVKLVAEYAAECTEELASAALGAKPMTKSSVVSEFAAKAKAATKEAAETEVKAEPVKAEPTAPAAGASVAHAYPEGTVFTETTGVAPKQGYSAGDSLNAQAPDVKPTHTPTPEQVKDFEGDTINPAISEGIVPGRHPNLHPGKAAVDAITDIAAKVNAANPDLPNIKVGEDGVMVVDMGEITGIPMRLNKPCQDRNAERVLKRVIGSRAIHISLEDAARPQAVDTITYCDETRTIAVKCESVEYSIICDLESEVRPVFKLVHGDLKALGLLIDYDFGRCTNHYCITSNLLMTRLLGNGNTLSPALFAKK